MSENRIERYLNEQGKKVSPQDLQRLQTLMERMAVIADELYDMMDPGLTVELNLPPKEKIIQLNQKSRMRKVLITRPNMHLQVNVPKGSL